jgi:hypothetical protein
MKKNPPVCPNCGTVFDPETTLRTRRRSAEKKAAVAPAPEEIIDDLPVAEGEAEDAVIEDAEELGDAEVEEVLEVEETVEDR